MNTKHEHLSDWTLEQMAEESLQHSSALPGSVFDSLPSLPSLPDSMEEAERGAAVEHLESCERCQVEFQSYLALFAELESLPLLSPSFDFAERVMAKVAVPVRVPLWDRALERLPSTQKGWALLAAFAAAPVLSAFALYVWLSSTMSAPATSLYARAFPWLIRTSHEAWGVVATSGIAQGISDVVVRISFLLLEVPQGLLSVALVLFALAIPVSAWALLRFARSPHGASYAHG